MQQNVLFLPKLTDIALFYVTLIENILKCKFLSDKEYSLYNFELGT